MTTVAFAPMERWEALPWKHLQRNVLKLQKRSFARLSHAAILTLVRTSPWSRRPLKAWLKAGVVDSGELFPTPVGTIQSGTVSPLLMNLALHGLETLMGTRFRRNGRTGVNPPRVIRAADDIVILASRRAERAARPRVREELAERPRIDVATQ